MDNNRIYLFLLIVGILVAVFCWLRFFGIFRLRRILSSFGCVVVGHRGKGKDLAFAAFVHKRLHYSNIRYNEYSIVKDDLTFLECGVTPQDLIDNTYELQRKQLLDGVPTVISDGGVHFASWLDNVLKKNYPSLPVSIALWRHLFNSSLCFNTQVFSRLWLLIREQAECVLQAVSSFKLGFKKFGWMLCKVRYYEDFRDCENGLRPLKAHLFSKAEVKVEHSKRGKVYEFRYLLPLRWLKYDTRIFHTKLYGIAAPTKAAAADARDAALDALLELEREQGQSEQAGADNTPPSQA